MFRSAVFKLTAVYLAIVMAITIGFSIALYKVAVSDLKTGFYNQYIRWLTEYSAYGLRQPNNPAAELAARSHHIYLRIMYFNFLVFVLTGIASYLLARRTLRPIERAHEQQKRFTADVSHELRTPLTALTMDTEVTLLDKNATSKDLRHTLEGNLEEARRMEHLVNNLLQLASLEADEFRTAFTRVNMQEVAESAVQMTRKTAEIKGITIRSDLQPGYVTGSRDSLMQLALILLDNAIKYSPEGSTVSIQTKPSRQSLSLIVGDSGPGIPAEAMPHIFDRFYRADGSRSSTSTRGYGLGLSLAKLIADVHGAEIVLTSVEGKGTEALVRLPSTARKNS